jgi:hypothetical protein
MSLNSRSHAIYVIIMAWNGEHRGFVIETLKNGDSVIATQRGLRRNFGVGRHGRVPDRKIMLLWLGNLRKTGSALKQKSSGRPRSARTPENIAAVRQAVATSPQRSAVKHALALAISERSVRRILDADRKFHPYKMMVVQELRECDWLNRQTSCEAILENVSADTDVFSSDFSVRLQECIAREGKHLDDIVFKIKRGH